MLPILYWTSCKILYDFTLSLPLKAPKKTYYFALFFFLHFNICSADTRSTAQSIKNLDFYIQQKINEHKAIGCAVAVVDRGKIVFIKTYGIQKKGENSPITPDTIFQLGSISKSISATLIALLIKEKTLALNTPVSPLYPHISSETTIHHILSHTTGYKRAGWNKKIEEHQSRRKLLTQLAVSPQNRPMCTYDYHNLAYSLIEEVVAAALQEPFKKVLEDKLLSPLEMHRTIIGDVDFSQQKNYAWPHRQDAKGILQPCKTYSRAYHRTVSSAGGISASIKDMAIFLQLQMGARSDILEPQNLALFHKPVIYAPDAMNWLKKDIKGHFKSYYGLGWRIIDNGKKRIVFHGGWLKGFTNFLGFMPARQIGIVILHNGESSLSTKAAMIFFDSL